VLALELLYGLRQFLLGFSSTDALVLCKPEEWDFSIFLSKVASCSASQGVQPSDILWHTTVRSGLPLVLPPRSSKLTTSYNRPCEGVKRN